MNLIDLALKISRTEFIPQQFDAMHLGFNQTSPMIA